MKIPRKAAVMAVVVGLVATLLTSCGRKSSHVDCHSIALAAVTRPYPGAPAARPVSFRKAPDRPRPRPRPAPRSHVVHVIHHAAPRPAPPRPVVVHHVVHHPAPHPAPTLHVVHHVAPRPRTTHVVHHHHDDDLCH